MKITQSVTQIGNGKWILVPKKIVDYLALNKGDLVEVDIQKLPSSKLTVDTQIASEEIISYRCLACDHVFHLNSKDDLYCPSCGEENEKAFVRKFEDLEELEVQNGHH